MKRSKVSVLGGALLAGVLAMSIGSPASADSTPVPKDVVGTGSDTTQYVMNYLADGATIGGSLRPGYNATASARLVSFDAVTPDGLIHNSITLKAGTTAVTRPNGSGEGKALLFGAGNTTAANYARSSSALSSAEAAANLRLVPFALDSIRLAVRAAGHSSPAAITGAQMLSIYKGDVTNWNQIGGNAGVIVPMIPQAGSGTRATFLAQLKSLNGGVDVALASSVVEVQEHDPAPIAANANAVAPFSAGRAGSEPTVSLVVGTGSWVFTRALYNVVRAADLNTAWFRAVFSSDGYICSGGGTQFIAAGGFQQLAGPLDDGVCGVPTTTATTNFTVN